MNGESEIGDTCYALMVAPLSAKGDPDVTGVGV